MAQPPNDEPPHCSAKDPLFRASTLTLAHLGLGLIRATKALVRTQEANS